MKTKYKKIIGGTAEEAESKFSFLKDADIREATIDITEHYLIWKGGVWKGGVWKGGKMWSNIGQEYQDVELENGRFVKND